jgi:hypothetical protein
MMTTDEMTIAKIEHSVTVFGTDEPLGVISRAGEVASAVARVAKEYGLISRIGDRDYARVEAWSLMGTMLGVYPIPRVVRELRDWIDGEERIIGFEANVELVSRDGSIVGGAIAECTRGEANWERSDAYAIKSMAQTRAVGKAYRLSFGFIFAMAGLESTPYEEMPQDVPVFRESAEPVDLFDGDPLEPTDICQHGVGDEQISIWWREAEKRGIDATVCLCCGGPASGTATCKRCAS